MMTLCTLIIQEHSSSEGRKGRGEEQKLRQGPLAEMKRACARAVPSEEQAPSQDLMGSLFQSSDVLWPTEISFMPFECLYTGHTLSSLLQASLVFIVTLL